MVKSRLWRLLTFNPLSPCGRGLGRGVILQSRIAFGDDQKHNCGWLPPLHPGAHFFCSAKRNGRKKRPPGWRDYPLRFSPESALASTRRALYNAPRAQTRGSLLPIPAAMLGRAIRGLEQHPALPKLFSSWPCGVCWFS
jgi:hypothetical protein